MRQKRLRVAARNESKVRTEVDAEGTALQGTGLPVRFPRDSEPLGWINMEKEVSLKECDSLVIMKAGRFRIFRMAPRVVGPGKNHCRS